MKRISLWVIVLVVAVGLVGFIHSTAFAVDLNGEYSGKWKCKVTHNDGTRSILRNNNSDMVIIHDTTTDTLQATIDGVDYNGRVIPDAKKPEKKGTAIFIAVPTDNDPSSGYDEMERIKVKKGGKRIEKRGLYVDEFEGIGECMGAWKWKRDVSP